MEIGWKVLTEARHSAIRKHWCFGSRTYPKLKKVEPKEDCGPLCVFDCLIHAQRFVTNWDSIGLTIVKCKYKKSKLKHIWDKWDNYHIPNCHIPIIALPEGTVLADSVTCLE